jgi:hypothetical protein
VLRREYPGHICSIARSLEVVGERWTLLIREFAPALIVLIQDEEFWS